MICLQLYVCCVFAVLYRICHYRLPFWARRLLVDARFLRVLPTLNHRSASLCISSGAERRCLTKAAFLDRLVFVEDLKFDALLPDNGFLDFVLLICLQRRILNNGLLLWCFCELRHFLEVVELIVFLKFSAANVVVECVIIHANRRLYFLRPDLFKLKRIALSYVASFHLLVQVLLQCVSLYFLLQLRLIFVLVDAHYHVGLCRAQLRSLLGFFEVLLYHLALFTLLLLLYLHDSIQLLLLSVLLRFLVLDGLHDFLNPWSSYLLGLYHLLDHLLVVCKIVSEILSNLLLDLQSHVLLFQLVSIYFLQIRHLNLALYVVVAQKQLFPFIHLRARPVVLERARLESVYWFQLFRLGSHYRDEGGHSLLNLEPVVHFHVLYWLRSGNARLLVVFYRLYVQSQLLDLLFLFCARLWRCASHSTARRGLRLLFSAATKH